MRRIHYYTKKRYRLIRKEEIFRCSEWFRKENFYFFSKRPDSLIPGNIDEILTNSQVFVDEKDKAVGLLRADDGFFTNIYARLYEFRFPDKEYYINSLGERLLGNYIHCFFYETNRFVNKIIFRVYGFDELTVQFLENLQIQREVILSSHIYKFGQYHPLYLYSVNRNEYLLANGLKE